MNLTEELATDEEFTKLYKEHGNLLKAMTYYLCIPDWVEFAHSYDELDHRGWRQENGRRLAKKVQPVIAPWVNLCKLEPRDTHRHKPERQRLLHRMLLINERDTRNRYLQKLDKCAHFLTDKCLECSEEHKYYLKDLIDDPTSCTKMQPNTPEKYKLLLFAILQLNEITCTLLLQSGHSYVSSSGYILDKDMY